MFEFGAIPHKHGWTSIKRFAYVSSIPIPLQMPKPDLDPPGTKSVSGRLTLIAAAPR